MAKILTLPELEKRHAELHPNDVWDGPGARFRGELVWTRLDEKCLEGTFSCAPRFEGFPGFVHGGVLTALLDVAFFQMLVGQNILAWTVDLNTRFHRPLIIGIPAIVRTAVVTCKMGSLYELEGTITQESNLKVSAKSRFLSHEEAANLTRIFVIKDRDSRKRH